MTTDRIIMIASIVMTVAAFAWGLYQQVKGNSAAAAAAFISQIEETIFTGPEKMAYVVNQLYELIPAPFKSILTKSVLQATAQKIFEYMRKYANAYSESKAGKGKEAYSEANKELAGGMADKLFALGTVGIKTLASELGIETEGLDEKELVKNIMLLLLENPMEGTK